MHKTKRTCPICQQNGKETSLELRQINLTEAVYICEDRNCIYPIGSQWSYVKNNILEDSDNSSEDSFDMTCDNKIFSNPKNESVNNSKSTIKKKLSSETHPKNDNLTTKFCKEENKQTSVQTYDLKDKLCVVSDKKEINSLNIISNVVIEDPYHLLSALNKKDYVKTNEIGLKTHENIPKNNVRIVNNKINKNKTQNSSAALPESVFINARALSKYFSSTEEQSKKRNIKTKSVFDIIQQSAIKQKEFRKSANLTENRKTSRKTTDLILNKPSQEPNNCIKEENAEVNSDNKFINNLLDNALASEQGKINNELAVAFDDLLFKNEDKYDTKNEELDFSEMDELLSFL